MDINKAFTYPFEDKQWISKLGMGAIIGLIPILNFAWTGYMVGLLRNVSNGEAEPLPNWDNIEKKFMDGLILAAAGLVYGLPILVLICLPMSMIAASGMLSGDSNLQDFSQITGVIGGALSFLLVCGFLIYGLFLTIAYPAILVIFAREGTFASCFKFREAINLISRNSGPFFTAWGISILAGLVVGFVASGVTAMLGWIPCLGWIVALIVSVGTTVYTMVVYAHLFGQFSALAARN